MSLYWIVFMLGIIAACFDIGGKRIVVRAGHKKINALFACIMTILLLMLVFRYGQGTDYFGYEYWFKTANENSAENLILGRKYYHAEIGWLFLNKILGTFGADFQGVVAIIAIVEILLLVRFIKKYSDGKECFAILLLIPTFILTYGFSGMRQGLVMCIWGGVCCLAWKRGNMEGILSEPYYVQHFI